MAKADNTGLETATAAAAGPALADPAEGRRLSYLDQALWKQLGEAETEEEFARYWLTLQSRMLDGAVRAEVILGPAETGPFASAVRWPAGDPGADGLRISAERALADRRGVVYGHSANAGTTCFAAYPFLLQGRLRGAVAVEIGDRPEAQLRAVMRQLQWGAAWIEMWQWRQRAGEAETLRERASVALDLVAVATEEAGFEAAALAVVTEMAAALSCERVSLGFVGRGHVRVAALSNTARPTAKTSLVRAIGAAMDEAIDQKQTLCRSPAGDEIPYVTAAHSALAGTDGPASVLTVPFGDGDGDRPLGAFTLERGGASGFDESELRLADLLAALLGPILDAKRREERWLPVKAGEAGRNQLRRLFGPRHLGRKLAALLAVAALALGYAVVDVYRVTANASVEGMVRRAVVAPFEGYILAEHVHAGDLVRKDDVLAELDVYDLALKRLRMVSARAQRLAEYNQALAERRAADVNVIQAQIDQAAAEVALYDEQINRAKLRAPFDGLVLSGDLSQSVGSSVSRGDVLFELGPLDAYRVILKVDDRQIRDVAVGQTGSVLLASLPQTPLPITVERVTPVSEAGEGRNLFRVEARLEQVVERLRPGMEGIAKVEVGEQRLVWIWLRPLVDWLRIKVWAFFP